MIGPAKLVRHRFAGRPHLGLMETTVTAGRPDTPRGDGGWRPPSGRRRPAATARGARRSAHQRQRRPKAAVGAVPERARGNATADAAVRPATVRGAGPGAERFGGVATIVGEDRPAIAGQLPMPLLHPLPSLRVRRSSSRSPGPRRRCHAKSTASPPAEAAAPPGRRCRTRRASSPSHLPAVAGGTADGVDRHGPASAPHRAVG